MDGTLIAGVDPQALGRLLTLGEASIGAEWPDYTGYGIGPEHIDGLIGLACDPGLHKAKHDSKAVWAPLHAWRALGQLRATEAIEPLLRLLQTLEDDDYACQEIPIVLGMIGLAAIPAITSVVDNPFTPALLAGSAITGLEQIALNHPGCRSECIDIVTRLLCRSGTDRLARGLGASSLLKLNAVEAIEPLRDAFRRDLVDISVAGDLEDIEIALGFRTHRDTPKPHYFKAEGWSLPPRGLSPDAPVRAEKTSRNDPCPCGSGRKFKKCCLQ